MYNVWVPIPMWQGSKLHTFHYISVCLLLQWKVLLSCLYILICDKDQGSGFTKIIRVYFYVFQDFQHVKHSPHITLVWLASMDHTQCYLKEAIIYMSIISQTLYSDTAFKPVWIFVWLKSSSFSNRFSHSSHCRIFFFIMSFHMPLKCCLLCKTFPTL